MDGSLLTFRKDNNLYKKIAQTRSDKGDLLGAISALFSALKNDDKDYETLEKIATIYADMGVLEESNQFWFYYLLKAPKSKISTAYAELAINYFYMDNLFASSYYFHKKFELDGYISNEPLDDEITEFLSNDIFKKTAYRLVYPFERADFSRVFKSARRAFAIGDFLSAITIFSSVPDECMTEDEFGEYAISLFMCDKDEEAISICKKSIELNGENPTAYCNLATFYNAKSNEDKSNYYYQKALLVRKYDQDEPYKIAGCAIEKKDYLVARDCLKVIINEKPFDPMMRFF